jgi:hypothetical protein
MEKLVPRGVYLRALPIDLVRSFNHPGVVGSGVPPEKRADGRQVTESHACRSRRRFDATRLVDASDRS